jgi:hypothetical protein
VVWWSETIKEVAMFIVMCEKSGGVTGYGCTTLKKDGKVRTFETRKEAQMEAAKLNMSMNHVYATATYNYWVEEY